MSNKLGVQGRDGQLVPEEVEPKISKAFSEPWENVYEPG